MSDIIKAKDVPEDFVGTAEELFEEGHWSNNTKANVARFLNAAIEAGLVSPPCHYIAYPSGMPVMHEPGEPIQIFPGKCSNPHERHWKGQTY